MENSGKVNYNRLGIKNCYIHPCYPSVSSLHKSFHPVFQSLPWSLLASPGISKPLLVSKSNSKISRREVRIGWMTKHWPLNEQTEIMNVWTKSEVLVFHNFLHKWHPLNHTIFVVFSFHPYPKISVCLLSSHLKGLLIVGPKHLWSSSGAQYMWVVDDWLVACWLARKANYLILGDILQPAINFKFRFWV